MKNSLPLQAIFLILPKQKLNLFLEEINLIFVSLFGGAKVRTIFQLQNIFSKNYL